MRNILNTNGVMGFVFDEGTCFNSSFPVYFVFFKPMFDQKAKYQSSGRAELCQHVGVGHVYFMFIV